jgi:hypothetical protein
MHLFKTTWSWPPKIMSIYVYYLAKSRSGPFLICVNAITKSHFYYFFKNVEVFWQYSTTFSHYNKS